uniref:Uncharacterized protein n=1 Tax=Opuntia streptacantha TaxID=393608 RepID=A0A7C9AJX7_OPUST
MYLPLCLCVCNTTSLQLFDAATSAIHSSISGSARSRDRIRILNHLIHMPSHSYQDRTICKRIAIWNVRPETGVVFVPKRSGTSSGSENWAIPFQRDTEYITQRQSKG